MKILSLIDRGGFGRVEKVQLPDGTLAALKTFDPDPAVLASASRDVLLKRFVREVATQIAITGEFAIPILAHDLKAKEPWYLMPLAAKNFSQEIALAKASGIIPTEALTDIINALEELHKLDLKHRDLRPENILFHDGRWKLADFGLVTPPKNAKTVLTSGLHSFGTQQYTAPEQVVDFKHVTIQTDIYSFGCILHDIVANAVRVPYGRHSCAGDLQFVVEKCTEHDLNRRFKTIRDVRAALLSVLTKSSTTSAADPTAQQWIADLPNLPNWTDDNITDFIRYIKNLATPADKKALFASVDEVVLDMAHARDQNLWLNLSEEYCAAAHGGFDFAICDVIVGRLEAIFNNGPLENKALAAVAAAELGASHNRWFVMKKLLEICGPNLDETVAQRIAIEIVSEGKANQFERCASGVQCDVTSYHPKIADLLKSLRPVVPPP